MTNIPALDIPRLLKRYNLQPTKSLGQNFLVDENALARIIQVAAIKPHETVLEVGAGLGSLTRHLAQAAHGVVAVELDTHLLPPLAEVLAPFQNVTLVQGDILKMDPAQLVPPGDYLVVANIPYYITSAVIRHLLAAENRPTRLILTIQQEVADRICSLPGDLSLLALSVQVFGQPRLLFNIPARSFFPVPKVDSTVLAVEIFHEPLIPYADLDHFFTLARAGFSQKRKQLRNSLASGLKISPPLAESLLLSAGIAPQRRAETVSLQEWVVLTSLFASRS